MNNRPQLYRRLVISVVVGDWEEGRGRCYDDKITFQQKSPSPGGFLSLRPSHGLNNTLSYNTSNFRSNRVIHPSALCFPFLAGWVGLSVLWYQVIAAASSQAETKAPPPRLESLTLEPISLISGEIDLPGSKSLSNRVLLLSALAEVLRNMCPRSCHAGTLFFFVGIFRLKLELLSVP